MGTGRIFLFEEFDDGAVPGFTRCVIEYDRLFLSLPGDRLGHLGIDEEILEGHRVKPMSVESCDCGDMVRGEDET